MQSCTIPDFHSAFIIIESVQEISHQRDHVWFVLSYGFAQCL